MPVTPSHEEPIMMGTLLESRAKRQRRGGGMALSVAVHMAIIAATVAGTVETTSASAKTPPPTIVYLKTDPPKAEVRTPETTKRYLGDIAPDIKIIRVDPPAIIPTNIPPIDLSSAVSTNDMIVVGGGERGKAPSLAAAVGGGVAGDKDGGNDWKGNDIFTHVLAQGKPRYPESLRSAGVDGRVLVQFVVDTTGRIDMASVKFLSSTHDMFSRAVRDALGAFRFRPAEAHGKKTPALAEMPFEFQIPHGRP
jgi:protein TonB